MKPREVEVFVPFATNWSSGFEVVDAELDDHGVERFRIRRHSDGAILPIPLPANRIRPANPDSDHPPRM